MRNRLTVLGFAVLTLLVVGAVACDGKTNRQCGDEQMVCVRGSWEVMCEAFVRGDAEVVPMECCTWGEDASASTGRPDGGFVPPLFDAGRAGRDASRRTPPPIGDCGDGGWPYAVDSGWFHSLFDAGRIRPPGPDDGGNVHVWQCFIDVCNPPKWSWDGGIMYDGGGLWWLFPNTGDASVANCGPLGCP